MPVTRYGQQQNMYDYVGGYDSHKRSTHKATGFKTRFGLMLSGRNRYGQKTAAAGIGKGLLWTGVGIAAGVAGAATGGFAGAAIIAGAVGASASATAAAEKQTEKEFRGTDVHKEIAETNVGKKAAGAAITTALAAAGGYAAQAGKGASAAGTTAEGVKTADATGKIALNANKFQNVELARTPMNISGTTPMQFGDKVAPLSNIKTGASIPSSLTTAQSTPYSHMAYESAKTAPKGLSKAISTTKEFADKPVSTILDKIKAGEKVPKQMVKQLDKFGKQAIKKGYTSIGQKAVDSITSDNKKSMKEAEEKAKEIDETISEGGYDIKREEISQGIAEKPEIGTPEYYKYLQRKQLDSDMNNLYTA